MDEYVIPTEFFARAAELVTTPLACVDLEHKFLWVNPAWEKLVGYSVQELSAKTWMEITHDEDVGGDYKSANAVIDEGDYQYTTQKRYITKGGQVVPVSITVWRHPMVGPQECFVVQATQADCHEIDKLRKEFDVFRGELAVIQRRHEIFTEIMKYARVAWPFVVAGIGAIWAIVQFILERNG